MILTASASAALLVVHHQRDVFEKTLQVLELLHRAHQFFQVLQPPGGVGGTVLLPHFGVAGFVEDDFGELGMRQAIALAAPAVERLDQPAQGAARLRLELVGRDHGAHRFGERHAALAGVIVQELHGGVAEPALGHIDDALEGEIVGRRIDHAQISQRIANFSALVEPRAADDAIRQPERDEAVFEFAHLERGAHQDGDLVERVARPRCNCSISSPMARASSSESQAPVTATFSPSSSSVRSVLPRRPSLCAIRCEAAARIWPVER